MFHNDISTSINGVISNLVMLNGMKLIIQSSMIVGCVGECFVLFYSFLIFEFLTLSFISAFVFYVNFCRKVLETDFHKYVNDACSCGYVPPATPGSHSLNSI